MTEDSYLMFALNSILEKNKVPGSKTFPGTNPPYHDIPINIWCILMSETCTTSSISDACNLVACGLQ